MTQDIDDLIARLNKGAKPLVIYEGTRNETRKVLADDALRLQVLVREAAAALREQRDEIARLQKLEKQCWTSPEQWMAWCDIRVLERAERAEEKIKELDALRKDAERYRWLRQCTGKEWDDMQNLRMAGGQKNLDAAIDAAITKLEQEQGR